MASDTKIKRLEEQLKKEKERRMKLQATMRDWYDLAIFATFLAKNEAQEEAYSMLAIDILSRYSES